MRSSPSDRRGLIVLSCPLLTSFCLKKIDCPTYSGAAGSCFQLNMWRVGGSIRLDPCAAVRLPALIQGGNFVAPTISLLGSPASVVLAGPGGFEVYFIVPVSPLPPDMWKVSRNLHVTRRP